MLRIKFGDRQWRFDETAPMTMGDIIAMREMGLEPDRFEIMLSRVGGVAGDPSRLSDLDGLELAQNIAQLAYIAAVREDHQLRWRDFVWSIPLDDLQAFDLDDDPAEPTGPPTAESAVGAALAEAGVAKPKAAKTARRK